MLIPLGILDYPVSAGVASDYDLLETEILTGTQASVTFSSLGSYSSYQHLQIRIAARSGRSGAPDSPVGIQLNGVTSGYALHYLEGNGSSVASGALTSQTTGFLGSVTGATAPASAFGAIVVDVLDFSSSAKNTTVRSFAGESTSVPYVYLTSTLYGSTTAVTSITINERTGANFVTDSRFSLYGLKGA